MFKMTRALVTTAGLFLGLLAVISCAGRQEPAQKDVLAICDSCHSPTGVKFNDYIPNLAGQNYAYLVSQLRQFHAIHDKEGLRANPIMEWHTMRIDETDIDRLSQYYARQSCVTGTYTWIGNDLNKVCSTCHGPHGLSSDPSIPNLAGQKVPYMRSQMIAFQNSAKGQANINPHIQRSSGRMGQPTENMPDDVMAALYYFNAQDCR